MIPFVGLLLGPVAFILGLVALRRKRADGPAHALAAVLLGALVSLTNWIGLYLIWIGITSPQG